VPVQDLRRIGHDAALVLRKRRDRLAQTHPSFGDHRYIPKATFPADQRRTRRRSNRRALVDSKHRSVAANAQQDRRTKAARRAQQREIAEATIVHGHARGTGQQHASARILMLSGEPRIIAPAPVDSAIEPNSGLGARPDLRACRERRTGSL
jgi:hypothetical protein